MKDVVVNPEVFGVVRSANFVRLSLSVRPPAPGCFFFGESGRVFVTSEVTCHRTGFCSI